MIHGTVAQEVLLAAPLATVWSAFAVREFRERWFSLPGERSSRSHELDFRIGGTEVTRSSFTNVDHVEHLELQARFLDIRPRNRITVASEFRLDDELRIASVISTEFAESTEGVLVRYTEQYQCFGLVGDGSGDQERGEREGGTRFLLRRLSIAVEEFRKSV